MNNKKKILIGYDSSQHSEVIVEDLQKAGIPDESEVVVLTVAEAWELPSVVDRVSPDSGKFVHPNVSAIQKHLAEISEKSKTIADDAVRRISENFPGWKITGEDVFGKPAAELIKKADEWKPDLLIVGSHGRSAIGRLILGSVSQKVLYEARCSVRIAKKRDETENPAVRVLIAVDGSANAEETVREVAGRNWKKETEIRLIGVDDPFTRPEIGYLPWNLEHDKPVDNEEARAWIERVFNSPRQILKSSGLSVSEIIRWGDAASLILKEADEWKADSIFLGARGLGRLKRFLLGSVSSSVAAKSKCSVEIIR